MYIGSYKVNNKFHQMPSIWHMLWHFYEVHKTVIDSGLYYGLLVLLIKNYQNFWFLFYHHLQLMPTLSKIHSPLLKKLLILIIIFL